MPPREREESESGHRGVADFYYRKKNSQCQWSRDDEQ